MSKINVVLTAVMYTDKGELQPGETVSMEEGEARKLAALGMVKLPESRKHGTARNGAKTAKEKSPEGETGDSGQTASESPAQEQS
jgi:hypothetical protein